MTDTILVTGGAGLVGSECCRLFTDMGWKVISVDNYKRGEIFGEEGDTKKTMSNLLRDYEIEHHVMDFRDEKIIPVIKKADAIIHTAAQPSHPKSIEIPDIDFEINAQGAFFLLERVRKYNKDIPFVFCSTNKVYGETPNYFAYKKVGKRFEPVDPTLKDGFDESLRVDQTMHTPFGVSKTAADFYTQEYGLLYGLKTGVFRMGCITGGAAMAVEMHNWEPYFVKMALTGEKLMIYGYEGYQVRDVIHAKDLAKLFYEFIKSPKCGEVYNIGGGRKNSISLLESFDLIEKITGKRINYEYGQEREADHIWWISNMGKVKRHFPEWDVRISLEEVFCDIFEVLAPTFENKIGGTI